MRWLKLTMAYDGTDFAGWQVQPNGRTVQETLERAIYKVTGEQGRAVASGRTDSGVHAQGQVVSIATESRLTLHVLRRALNAELPDDVAVLSIEEAAAGFHATRDAVSKRYRYWLHDGPVREVLRRRYLWQWFIRLDEAAMHRAAQALQGTHDFTSFASLGAERTSNVRTIADIRVERGRGEKADLITIEVTADGFLYNMVRAIVGTLVEVGRGYQPEDWPGKVLQAKDRSQAGMTAPPQGLFLERVDY